MPEPGVVRRFARGTQTMRIGERLVQDGLITPEQLARALRVQAEQGGRLGSNLIDLGFLEQDRLARYLGRYHGMPPALARHFDLRDPVLPTRLSAELAARWGVIPIATLAGEPGRIAVAVMDPLPAAAVEQISAALGREIVTAITAEIRVHQYLERVYGIPPTEIALRSERLPLPILLGDEDVECEMSLHIEGDPLDDAADVLTGIERAGEDAYLDAIGDAIELDLDQDISDALEEDGGSTKSTKTGTICPKGAGGNGVPQEISDTDSTRTTNPIAVAKLGRISLKRIVPPMSAPASAAAEKPAGTLDEVLRAMRQATGRDKVGDLVVEALQDLFDQVLEVGAILVLRDSHLVGWKGFVRDGRPDRVKEIALPLRAVSVIGDACRSRQTFVGPLREGESEADRNLWTALGTQPPRTVAVVPVVLEAQLACVLYAHTQVMPERAVPVIEDQLSPLASAAAAAFERLIRASRR